MSPWSLIFKFRFLNPFSEDSKERVFGTLAKWFKKYNLKKSLHGCIEGTFESNISKFGKIR